MILTQDCLQEVYFHPVQEYVWNQMFRMLSTKQGGSSRAAGWKQSCCLQQEAVMFLPGIRSQSYIVLSVTELPKGEARRAQSQEQQSAPVTPGLLAEQLISGVTQVCSPQIEQGPEHHQCSHCRSALNATRKLYSCISCASKSLMLCWNPELGCSDSEGK